MENPQTSDFAGEHATLGVNRLKNDSLELTVVPDYGLHWTRLRISAKGKWLDLLAPVEEPESLLEGGSHLGSYFLAPWSNRVACAQFQFEGGTYRLRPNFKDGTAIHGDVRTRPWRILDAGDDCIEASLDSRDFADFNFPFPLRFHERIELSPAGLRTSTWIENAHDARVPVGFGFHPYFRRKLTDRDRDLVLILPASKVYPAVGCLPTGPAADVPAESRMTDPRLLGAPDLDHCFTGLEDPHKIRLFWPGTGVQVHLDLDPVFTHTVVYAPNGPDGRPRDFVAVEPVTQANDGFNCLARGWKGTGVKVLEPGERWGGSWELSVGDI